MKYRIGFVSNSSSSSFCIIGIDKAEIIKELLNKEHISEIRLEFGMMDGKNVIYYGSDGEIYYAGSSIKEFAEDVSIRDMKKAFKEKIQSTLGIKLNLQDIKLLYGEIGDG